MAVTPATQRVRFPEVSEVSSYPDAVLQLTIDDAMLQTDASIFGTLHDLAVSYLAMHFVYLRDLRVGEAGTLKGTSGAGGMLAPAASEAVGSVSTSNAAGSLSSPNDPDAAFLSNLYGQEFLRLRRLALPDAWMVV